MLIKKENSCQNLSELLHCISLKPSETLLWNLQRPVLFGSHSVPPWHFQSNCKCLLNYKVSIIFYYKTNYKLLFYYSTGSAVYRVYCVILSKVYCTKYCVHIRIAISIQPTNMFARYHSRFFVRIGNETTYCKVASSNTFRLEGHAGFFRLLMKEIFYPCVL